MANPINPDSQSTLTLERLFAIKAEIDKLGEFVNQAMIPDVAAVGALYADWTRHGAGVTDYLSVPDLPLDTKGTQFELPGGYVPKGDLSQFKPIASYRDAYFRDGVRESVKHAWYQYKGNDAARHPYEGQTHPHHTAFQDDGKYSWVKAPTFYDQRVQVGPLANVLWSPPAASRPSVISNACSTLPARWPARRSRSRRCTRPSAGSPPGRYVARCCWNRYKISGNC